MAVDSAASASALYYCSNTNPYELRRHASLSEEQRVGREFVREMQTLPPPRGERKSSNLHNPRRISKARGYVDA